MCGMKPPQGDGAPDASEEHVLPCAEAMLAGTLALMTGHAQHSDAGTRSLMAKKIVSNLFFLSGHPHLSDGFKTMLGNLRTRWQLELAPRGDTVVAPVQSSLPAALWHDVPTSVQ